MHEINNLDIMKIFELSLGDIVTANFKAAAVFEKYHMDFCCQGNRNFVDACDKAGLKPETIANEINKLGQNDAPVDFTQWPLDQLSDYIYRRHHSYVEQATPLIKKLLDKICSVHASFHPELLEIRDIFNKTSGELAMHMKKEELILFPFIKKLERVRQEGGNASSKLFKSVSSPIQSLEEEHKDEGEQLQRMAELSNNFTPPEDACLTYTTTYKALKDYELDIHQHIHLENNVLFPAAVRLEQQLTGHSSVL
jgi:regulator of cell morphogenesis and NO signaling